MKINQIAHLSESVAEGSEQISEYRDRLLQYVKSLLPNYPEYVLKDWLIPNKGDFSNLPDTELKNGIMEKLKGAGLTPNTKWQLVPDMKFTMDMFEPMSKERLIGRTSGNSDMGMGIPRDKERHATQAALAQQQGGVRKEPVLLIKTDKGYELLEGWHRTIQHFAKYPDGYTGPAYIAVAQQGVAEAAALVTHRIGLTVTDPNHPMVSKRGETYQKSVRVTGPDREAAINQAIAHYRRKGYKVHDHHYLGTVDKPMAEATGDKPFDQMMTTIKRGTNKQKTADRKEQQKQTQQQARNAFGNMFGGGNPADKLKIKEQGVAEGKVKLYTDPDYFGAEVDDAGFDSLPVVNISADRLVGFEPDSKMNQPKSKANVEKIIAGLEKGNKLPPLLVRKYKDGYQVLDGHHRFWAYKLLGTKSIPAQIVPAEDIEEIGKQGVAEEKCPHCNGPMVSEELINEKKDACYYKVKSRYKVWPSAYASGALVKCRKKGANNRGNGGKKNESSILEGIEQADESLHDWFNKEKWVRMDTKGNIKGPCAKEPGEGKPKCLPQAKAHSLGKKGRASAAARKRREDPNPERSGKAINVNTKKEKKVTEMDNRTPSGDRREKRVNSPEPKQGVAEAENKGQYEMMMRNGQVKKFIAKDDADARRIAAGHGAKSVIRMKGNVPGDKIGEQGVAEQWEPVSGYDTIYPRAKVIKSKNGKPIGEIYQDTYGWGCFHYKADNGADGMSSKEEALEQLKDMHNEHRQQGVTEGGVTVPNADGSLPPGAFTAAGQEQLNKMVGDKMNAPTNEKDLGNGFTLTTTSYNGQNYPAVLDTQGKIYWLERTPNIKTLGVGSHIKIVTGKATSGIPGDQTKDAMKQAGWEVDEPSQGEPQPAPSANAPFVPIDYQTKEPLTKGPDGNWRNSKGEARDGLHGGPISSTGTAMFRSLKETDAMANAASRLAKKKKQGVAEGWDKLTPQQKAHEYNLDAAQKEMDRRHAQGEDMTGAKIDKKTYKIVKPKKKDVSENKLPKPYKKWAS